MQQSVAQARHTPNHASQRVEVDERPPDMTWMGEVGDGLNAEGAED
jgi:hypothetical protein